MRALRMKHGALLLVMLVPMMAAAKSDSGLYLTPADALPVAEFDIATPAPVGSTVTLSADEMGMDEKNGVVVARGNVEVMQGESILTAKQITYYQKINLVIAEGDVTMLQPSGDVYFAEKAELKDSMKRGVIHNFKVRLADGSVLGARDAVKVNSSVTQLSKAAYTPCNLCTDAAPFWQMNANSATVDDISERVTYHGAFMEMSGVPVFYTPYLSHPTPNARAKSGFFFPTYGTNVYFGSFVKTPYYWRISEDKDVVLTPWVTTSEGPLLQWDYRQLRNAGNYRIQGSLTDPKSPYTSVNGASVNTLRGHIFAQGDEEVSEHSHVGFDIMRTSDDTYLRRYSFGDQQALFSRAYYEHANQRNFALAEGIAIQGLSSVNSQKTTPLVLPFLQGYYETPAYDNGLKFHVSGDAQSLTRDEGTDQSRLSITPGATVPFMTDDGQIFTATLNLRQDIYHADNVARGSSTLSGTTTRTLPQAALEWRYPLINALADGAWIVEPIVLAVAQTNGGNPSKISNEDSQLIELSDSNLFSLNRMPGLDLYDSGSRVAYGVRTHYYDTSDVAYDAMLGQSYAFDSDTPYPNSTRAGEQFSDYIGRTAVTYMPWMVAYRFAVDKEDANLNRNDIEVAFSKPWLSLSTSYRTLKNNRYLPDSREGVVNATLPVTESWSVYGGARRDLELDQMVTANGGIIYKNECFNIVFDGARAYARDRDIAPTTEFTFRVAFKNLGEFGGK